MCVVSSDSIGTLGSKKAHILGEPKDISHWKSVGVSPDYQAVSLVLSALTTDHASGRLFCYVGAPSLRTRHNP